MRRFIPTVAVAVALFALACGDQKSAETAVDDAAHDLAGRVEESADTMKDSYDAAREEGEGRLDAAGEAYDAVDEAGDDKDWE